MSKLPFLYRLLVPIVAAVVIGFAALDIVMINTVGSHYRDASLDAARNSLLKNASDIKGQVNESIQATEALARALSAQTADHNHFDEEAIMTLLHDLQQDNHGLFYGVWANWLPGKYPGTVSSAYLSDNHFAPMAFPAKDGGISKVTTTGHSGNDEKSLWFREPVNTGKLYMTEPTSYFIDGRDVNLITIGYPMRRNGEIVGVAGVNMNVNAVQEAISKLNYSDIGYAFLITDELKFFAHPNKDQIGKDASNEIPDIAEVRTALKEKIYTTMDNYLGEEVEIILEPLAFKDGGEIITLGMVLPTNQLYAFVNNLGLQAIMIAVALVVVISALVFLIIRQLVNKVGGEPEAVIEKVSKIANGDLRVEPLSEKVREDSLAYQVNKMAHHLAEVMQSFNSNSENLSESSNFLTKASSELAENTDLQSRSSTQVASAAMEMTQTIQEIAKNLTEMADYAKETGAKAQEGSRVVKTSAEGVHNIKVTAEESSESVTALQQSSDKIRDIVNVISDIAEQTNLLALNAAIEAARAGEQGRGFAVVADEVRGLASRTQQATLEISELVNSTQQDVDSVTKSMSQVSSQVASGVELSDQVSESLQQIVASVDSLEERLGTVSSATTEMAAASGEVEKNIHEVASVSDSVNQVASEVSGQAGNLNSMSQSIQQLVGRFTL